MKCLARWSRNLFRSSRKFRQHFPLQGKENRSRISRPNTPGAGMNTRRPKNEDQLLDLASKPGPGTFWVTQNYCEHFPYNRCGK